MQNSDKAPYSGAFFLCQLVLAGLLLTLLSQGTAKAGTAKATSCATPLIDTWVQVRHVIDGDTVVLADGRKVRLIGIDAPEIGYNGAPDEPLARQAQNGLRALLSLHQYRLGLHFDQERKDRYSRWLAHGFDGDGSSISATLLAKGLATQLIIPPNIWNAGCYRKQEALAEHSRLGLWARPEYQPKESVYIKSTKSKIRGFRRVRGRVSFVNTIRRVTWIHLEGGFRLWIKPQDLGYFTDWEPKTLLGLRVEARGLMLGTSGKQHMRIRHPVALRILSRQSKDTAQ